MAALITSKDILGLCDLSGTQTCHTCSSLWLEPLCVVQFFTSSLGVLLHTRRGGWTTGDFYSILLPLESLGADAHQGKRMKQSSEWVGQQDYVAFLRLEIGCWAPEIRWRN